MWDNNTRNKKSFIIIRYGIVVELSEEFTNLTGYSTSELIGKSYLEVSNMLKFNPENKSQHMKDNFNIYLFTKLLEPREVDVSLERNKNKNDIICFFDEKENSRLESKFLYVEQLYLDNNCGVAIYSSPDLVLLKANQKYIDYLNEPFNRKENCIGQKLDHIVKGFKGSVAEEIWANTVSTGKVFYASEVMYDRYDRGITYWDSSIVPIHEEGEVKYLIDNSIEVTERVVNRKLVEEQTTIIKSQNKEIKVIIDVVDEFISILDKNGKFIRLSKFLKELFELNEVNNINELNNKIKILDMDGNDIYPNNSILFLINNGKEINNYKCIIQNRNIKKYVVLNGKPIFNESENLVNYVLMTNDITEEMQSKDIEEQRNQLEAIIESMSDGIYITDKDGKIIVMNAEARDLLYRSETIKFAGDAMNTSKFFDMLGNEIDIDNMPLKRALKGERIRNERMLMERPDKKLNLRVNATPIYDINNNLIMALACTHDITDLVEKENIIIKKYKQLELLKEDADNASQVKSLFLANMSHEIRTPMNGILVTIQLLQSTTLSMEQSKYIKMLKQSSDILLTIINDILDISKIESGKFKLNNEPFFLKETIDSIYNNLLIIGNSKGLEVSYYLDPTLDCKLIGDELRIGQILNNLISNAIKFTEKGYISFKITQISSDNYYEEIEFTVKDTGIGIEESFKEKIFSNFNQGDISVSKKYMGTGLGLSISKQLATLMNAELKFESVVGQGSTFSFTCKMKRSCQENQM